MLHSIQPEKHAPFGKPMAEAVQACVHCGFCLAACPTYQELGQEMDTPRGRIVLMKQVLEGSLAWEAAQPHIDRCLGCLACEPACPSGVHYRDLISPFRALARSRFKLSAGERLRRFIASRTIPFPARFRLAMLGGRLAKPFQSLAPSVFRAMLELIPPKLPAAQKWPLTTPAQGPRRARVALLTGCAQQVLDPDINTATIEVLARNGVEVIVPPTQVCCGGLAWHTGDLRAAQTFARQNLAAFPCDVDAIVTNAAGCGSALQEYPLILSGTEDEKRAQAFQRQVLDVSVFLARLGLREPLSAMGVGEAQQESRKAQQESVLPLPLRGGEGRGEGASIHQSINPPIHQSISRPSNRLRIAYHDACHLAHAQNVRREPRQLLRAIPGVELCELPEPALCCGSAGTYNLDQPLIAASLGEKKARAVIATGAQIVASGNIGCLTQLRVHLAKLGFHIPVRHTMQILRDAYSTTAKME